MTKIAVLGNYATQFLVKSLKRELSNSSSPTELYEADYKQIDFEIINEGSELYVFQPDFIIIHESMLGLRDDFYKSAPSERKCYAVNRLERLEQLLSLINSRSPQAKVIYPTPELDNDMVFGHYYGKVESSFYFQLTKLNAGLQQLCLEQPSLFLVDSNHLRLSLAEKKDPTLAVNADLHFTLPFTSELSSSISKIIHSLKGSFKKCLILDLDNTTWGGVIGDDGMEGIQIGDLGIGKAFTRFQMWVKELKNRGIILAVCSKNNEEIAKEPFEKHSEMILRLEDIAVFVANWNNKADNIRHIQSVLNIGFDSMVFLDDNPAEREIVRQNVPEITVPELPEDPAYYVDFLIEQNLFETTSYSSEDKGRTKQYQEEAERKKMSLSVTNMDDYLKSLEMEATIKSFQAKDFPRIAQLSQRSNQFNLRTIRYSESDIEGLASDATYHTYALRLKDKFGDYGLVSIVIIKLLDGNSAFIDTWIMSCRVLKRALEFAAINKVVGDLKNKGVGILKGEYLPTPKNALVKNLLPNFGFRANDEKGINFSLQLDDFESHKHYIKIK